MEVSILLKVSSTMCSSFKSLSKLEVLSLSTTVDYGLRDIFFVFHLLKVDSTLSLIFKKSSIVLSILSTNAILEL